MPDRDTQNPPLTERAECPKCGGTDLYVVFHKQGCERPGCGCATCQYGSHAKEHREHLHVSCRRCQFDWVAPTLEQLAEMVA